MEAGGKTEEMKFDRRVRGCEVNAGKIEVHRRSERMDYPAPVVLGIAINDRVKIIRALLAEECLVVARADDSTGRRACRACLHTLASRCSDDKEIHAGVGLGRISAFSIKLDIVARPAD